MMGKLHLCALLFWAALGLAQQDSLDLPIDRDSDLVEREFQGDLVQKYSGEEFDYSVDRGESMNLLARMVKWFLKAMGNLFGIDVSPGTLLILEYIIYVLMGVLALFLLVRMLANESMGSLFTKKARSLVDLELSQRHIETIDLEGLLQAALQEGDYRLAVRYGFLRVLKQLSHRDIIDWHYEKTNMDYLGEISQTPLRDGFQGAVYLFENIWYGQRPIDQKGYLKAERHFNALNQMIP